MQETTDKHPVVPQVPGVSERDDFLGHSDRQIADWRALVDRLADQSSYLIDESREKMEELTLELRNKLAIARNKLEAIRNVAEERWEDARQAYEATAADILKMLRRAGIQVRRSQRNDVEH